MACDSRGLSRFAADLPPVENFISLGEGDTPVLQLDVLARRLGLDRLLANLESQNPTGSYKDRVAAMSLSLARQRDNVGWIATSSGNAGLAMAAYGARAALPGFLCLVASAPLEKRLPLMPYPIGVVAGEGVGRESTGRTDSGLVEQVCAAANQHNLYLGITAHAFNPSGMRGIDTIAYELAEQAPNATHVYVPTGGGGLLAAIARDLEHRTMPARVIACQPSGCAPIVRFLNGQIRTPEIERCDSDISALQIPRPPDGSLAADAVTRSNGWGTAPDDKAILVAQRLLAATEGVFVEPASAAALAALIDGLERNRLEPDDHPVLILAGAGSKDQSRFTTEAGHLPLVDLSEVPERINKWTANLHDRRSRIWHPHKKVAEAPKLGGVNMKVIVVGVGFMGTLHARTVRGSRLATLCGVVDRDERVAKAVGADMGVPSFTDLAHAIRETAPDAAIIATPDPEHREPAETLMRSGVHVLIEKPLATTLEDAQAIVGLAEVLGLRIMTGHLTRFYPRYTQAVDAVRSGDLGKPVLITTSTWGPKSLGARVSNVTSPLWHLAIHDIDTIQWISGGVIDEIDGAQTIDSSAGVSVFAATGSLTTGTSFHLAAGWTLPDTASPRWDLKVHCERGVVQAAWSNDGVTAYTAESARDMDCIAWPTLYGQVEGALRREVDHFLGALTDCTPFVITPEAAVDAVHSAVTLEKASTVRSLQ